MKLRLGLILALALAAVVGVFSALVGLVIGPLFGPIDDYWLIVGLHTLTAFLGALVGVAISIFRGRV